MWKALSGFFLKILFWPWNRIETSSNHWSPFQIICVCGSLFIIFAALKIFFLRKIELGLPLFWRTTFRALFSGLWIGLLGGLANGFVEAVNGRQMPVAPPDMDQYLDHLGLRAGWWLDSRTCDRKFPYPVFLAVRLHIFCE